MGLHPGLAVAVAKELRTAARDDRPLAVGGAPALADALRKELAAGGRPGWVRAGGAGANGQSVNPAISADGRFVAFYSGADNLSTGDNNSFENVFVRGTNGHARKTAGW